MSNALSTYFSPKGTAKKMELSVKTILRMVKRGDFPRACRINEAPARPVIRIPESDILAYAESRRVFSGPPPIPTPDADLEGTRACSLRALKRKERA